MYAKVFRSIYDGSLADNWKALVVFQQFLVLSSADGVVDMTAGAIARTTGLPLDLVQEGIAALESADPNSRSKEMDGRRIALLDDHRNWGWFIVNHRKYQQMQAAEEKREADRVRIRDKRALEAAERSKVADCRDVSQGVADCSEVSPEVANVAYIDVDTDKEQEHPLLPTVEGGVISPSGETTPSPPDGKDPPTKRRPDCPVKRIAAMFAEKLPELPQPDVWEGEIGRKRHAAVAARWREMAARYSWTEQAEGLEFFGRLFTFVSRSQFLMGRARPREKDGRPFQLRFDWLFRPTNFGEVIEGKYHDQTEKRRDRSVRGAEA